MNIDRIESHHPYLESRLEDGDQLVVEAFGKDFAAMLLSQDWSGIEKGPHRATVLLAIDALERKLSEQ